MSISQKLVTYNHFGDPDEVLKIKKKQVKAPMTNEVLVRMVSRPINPSDIIPITGAYSHRITLPAVPGYEGVGIIEDAGQSVSHDIIGKRVLPLRGEGTWQEYVITSADLAIPIPDSDRWIIFAPETVEHLRATILGQSQKPKRFEETPVYEYS